MFIIAFLIMIVSYFLLGQFHALPGFVMAFTFVAVGAAIFKPVVVGTVARVTNEANSATGFGIFYMMVNIGGFLGPIVAGLVRGWGWQYVFVACSGWALVNLVLVLVFYKEPPSDRTTSGLSGPCSTVWSRFWVTSGSSSRSESFSSGWSSPAYSPGLGFPWFSWGWAWIVL